MVGRQLTMNELERLLASNLGDECVDRCSADLYSGVVSMRDSMTGRAEAHRVHSLFSIRKDTVKASGRESCGFEKTLANLSACHPDQQILSVALEGPSRLYMIFVREGDRSFVGCIGLLDQAKALDDPA
jgi:hypothetical protein